MMTNQAKVDGNRNVTIQGVTDSTITLNVNGESKEILSKLETLQELMKELKVETFQKSDKIYNINSINETNFGVVTGTKSFNEVLIKNLMEIISPHSDVAEKFLSQKEGQADWESQSRHRESAKRIITTSFVGVIGIELRRLLEIGNEDIIESKQKRYLEKGLGVVKRSLDLICFTLISKLWDIQKQKYHSITEKQRNALVDFFDLNYALSINEQIDLLKNILEVFSEHAFVLPFPELKNFIEEMKDGSEFIKTIHNINLLSEKFEKGKSELIDCPELELQLAVFLKHFHFLADYRMASIMEIGYHEIRNDEPHYLHFYLPIRHGVKVDSKELKYTEETVHTDAILIYKGDDYQENIDLSPFIIDYNALTSRGGMKVYFYYSQNDLDDSLIYRPLDPGKDNDPKQEEIFLSYKGNLDTPDNIEKLLKENKQNEIKLDTVVKKFHEARSCILGEEKI